MALQSDRLYATSLRLSEWHQSFYSYNFSQIHLSSASPGVKIHLLHSRSQRPTAKDTKQDLAIQWQQT